MAALTNKGQNPSLELVWRPRLPLARFQKRQPLVFPVSHSSDNILFFLTTGQGCCFPAVNALQCSPAFMTYSGHSILVLPASKAAAIGNQQQCIPILFLFFSTILCWKHATVSYDMLFLTACHVSPQCVHMTAMTKQCGAYWATVRMTACLLADATGLYVKHAIACMSMVHSPCQTYAYAFVRTSPSFTWKRFPHVRR